MKDEISEILRQLTKQDAIFFDETCVFGYPVFRALFPGAGFIEVDLYGGDGYVNLVVVPEMRRTGVATRLFEIMLDWFESFDCKALRWNVHSLNKASIMFAQKMGFVEIGSNDDNERWFALGRKKQK